MSAPDDVPVGGAPSDATRVATHEPASVAPPSAADGPPPQAAASDGPVGGPEAAAQAVTGAPPMPAALRWAVVVLTPAVGFLVGLFITVAQVADMGRPHLPFLVLALGGGILGAVALLVTALLVVPWVPVAARATGTVDVDVVPAAPHPEGSSWVGPAAALLIGLGLGVTAGPSLTGRSDRPFSAPALTVLACAAAATVLLSLHQRHGEPGAPSGHALLHRLVLRALLRGVAAGLPAGILAGLAMSTVQTYGFTVDRDIAIGCLCGLMLAMGLTVAESLAWRVPPRLRWLVLVGCGLVTPVAAALLGLFLVALVDQGEPLLALKDVLDVLSRKFEWRPAEPVMAIAITVPPFVLLAAGRTGLVPYFGRRAPWPLVAQVPLAALAGAVLLALIEVCFNDLNRRKLQQGIRFLGVGLPAIVIGLRLCDPLEGRLVARWAHFTRGGG